MLDQLRQRLTYANVMATIAVFIALGGSSYAALQIDSGEIANNSVRSVDVRNRTLSDRDVKRNGLTGRSIRESRLDRVPHAREADRLGGMTAADLLLKCPEGTFLIADVCVETTPRSAVPYGAAVAACATSEPTRSPGRRLATYGELLTALGGVPARCRRRAHRRGLSLAREAGRRRRARCQHQGGGVEVVGQATWPGHSAVSPTPGTDPMRDHANTEGVRCHR